MTHHPPPSHEPTLASNRSVHPLPPPAEWPFPRTVGVLGDLQAEEEDDDGEDVAHVARQAEDVHRHGCWLIAVLEHGLLR